MYMVPKYAERVRGRTPKCVCSKGGCVDLVQCFGSKYVQGVQNPKNFAYVLNWKPPNCTAKFIRTKGFKHVFKFKCRIRHTLPSNDVNSFKSRFRSGSEVERKDASH